VKIWNGNASKEFLETQGLKYNEDDLGPIYGHQWRHFNAPYIDCKKNYKDSGVDQLSKIIKMLKDPKERKSRRIILSAWNPCQLEEMALPPCHVLVQFIVSKENKLSAILYQRSGDVGLGVPFNIASYAFLTHLLAIHCDLEPLELIYHLGHCHIYDNHLKEIEKHLERIPNEFPTIEITKKDEIENYLIEDTYS
jgi:thymidylate synthase